jgi:hypothetical protein
VGDDGLVRWSDELPNEQGHIDDDAAGVVAARRGIALGWVNDGKGYTALLRSGNIMDTTDMDLALAIVVADIN